ncbi:MAG: response regulator transcription factor [Candidatus Cloacimonetes bacterium]|nr:response regulator transcription factor [Candidatus Cloacimonadota bacterium]
MRILLVEDDKKIAGFVAKGLREENYAVDVFHNGEDGAYWAVANEYDIIILDIMLPMKNGIDVCREIRSNNILTPIIMLTAKDTTEDKVKGLNAGADDYLSKPFAFAELLARIQALLRRNQEFKSQILKAADLELDVNSRRVFRAGEEIILSGREYGLLEYLLRNKNKILTETKIIEHVWDMNSELFTNVVNVYIHHLRKKVDTGFEKKLIFTLRGRGYMLKDE